MSTIIDSIEQRQRRRVPRFDAGDRVRVHFQVIEGSRKRVQVFEGVVMKRQGSGLRETFTVRKQSFGVGVERTFPLHSPKIDKLEVAARGDVRRAKLYYLRDRVGKAARVAERRWGIEEDLLGAEEEHAIDAEGVSVEELAEAAEDEAADSEEAAAADASAADASAAGPVAADDSPEDAAPAGPVAADAPSDEPEGSSENATATPPAEEAAPADGEAEGEEQVDEPAESGEGEDEAEEPAEDGEEAAG